MILPTISVIIPTLNAAKVLEKCLSSISDQNYPKNKIEVIIADGGSSDQTILVAEKYGSKIITNKLKTSESGKAAGLKFAKMEIIAFIDSDNILPSRNWFRKMVRPFSDKEIVCSEPISFSYRKSDPILTRYFALLGMNDPLCLFLGNYDRWSVITNRWTGLNFPTKKMKGYLKVDLNKLPIPTIGANGALFRRSVLPTQKEYLFDIDLLIDMVKQFGHVQIAKVNVGIVHTFVESSPVKFFRKQLRRIDDFSYHLSKTNRSINWQQSYFWKIVWFQVQCLIILPILFQTAVGYFTKPDPAWFFHPIACYSTWFIYLYGWLKGKVSPAEYSRKKWHQ